MCFFPTLFNLFFSIILLQARRDSHIESRSMMGMWFLFLVPILLMMMVVESRFGGGNDEEKEIGSGTYHGEEEEEEEIESDEGQKQKETCDSVS